MALILIFIGALVIIKYLFTKTPKNNFSNIEDIQEEIEKTEQPDEKEENISEMFSDRKSIFLMISLFLFFIAIIIYISLGGFLK